MVGLQTLNLAIGVRVPASQPTISNPSVGSSLTLEPLNCRLGNLLVPIEPGNLLVPIQKGPLLSSIED